jgi:hypothetical protein
MPIFNEALARQRALTIWALVLLVALVPTALALMLAVQISRYGRKDMDPAWRMAVVRGLWLTLVLGASVGLLLSGRPPPNGEGLPVFGWHAVADLRPAHFLGMHAQQFLPLLGLLLLGWPELRARRALNLGVGVYALCWLGLSAMGLRAS